MTKDYAKRRRTQYSNILRQNSKQHTKLMPAWGWMSLGLMLGIFLCAVLYWKLNHHSTPESPLVEIHKAHAKPHAVKTPKNIKPKAHAKSLATTHHSTRFDFYNVLPKMNQDFEIAETSPNTLTLAMSQSTPDTKPKLADDELFKETTHDMPDAKPGLADDETFKRSSAAISQNSYIIQAGSFHRQEQAEELKAQLALSGFEASIQTFKMGNRETRYRVMIGPFSNKDQANLHQQELEQAQQLHSVVLKIRV
ncbi:MAG: SPOR domain-containing protein [Proteobacteria bacterium]|nr:SPOR domain-containing protein [Pseudomonadota bacterium]